MQSADLEFGLNFVSASEGVSLSVHEVAMLRASLAKLQASEKYGTVFFWGKIFGATRDYYIAYGIRATVAEFPVKQFYMATDANFVFADLPMLTKEEVSRIADFPRDSPFSGEPETNLFPKSEEEEAAAEEEDETELVLTELHRLTYVVQNIDYDCAVVPREAWIINDAHQVVPTPDWRGLGWTQLPDLTLYGHFRPAENIGKLRAMAKNDAEWRNHGFLDQVSGALPKGSWVTRMNALSSSVSLRSLLWPGYSFYAVADKSYYGSLYVGHGIKNYDLAFLLP